MSRSRVLFVVESGTDVRLVDGLAEHFQLSIIAREIEGGRAINWPSSTEIPTIIGPKGRVEFARFVFRALIRRNPDFDIALVQGYSLAALAANISRQFTSKPLLLLVCSPVEAYYRCRLTNPNGRPYQQHEATLLDFLARANAMAAPEYVVLSEHLENVVRRHGARRVNRIPIYGVDTQLFAPPQESKSDIRKKLGLPTDGTLIFFSSRIAPEKDSETLLRAVKRLVDSGHNIWLLHRSGGYKHFQEDAKRFGLLDRVVATDAVHPHQQLPLDYQACDVCVQASREEGLGFSPLEALACGTPVIATSVGGLKETILNGQTGWTYPVGDHVKLSLRIADVVLNPEEAQRRANKGRLLVSQRFDRRLVFRQFADLVANMTGTPQEVHA